MKPPLVICVHGIRTNAKWQKTAAEILSANKIPVRLYDFGYYGLHKFLNPFSNDKAVEEFYHEYNSIIRDKSFHLDTNN
jgi:hypothetical protein